MQIARTFAPLVDLIYPPRCPSCGEAISAQNGLCGACWAELVIPGTPCCTACQRPFGGAHGTEGVLCAVCLAELPQHDGIAAGTIYNDASRKLVLAFKHGRRIGLAPMLAKLIAARLPVLEGDWLAIPVPLHRWRLWQRGFNQSALLAGEVAQITGQTLAVDALYRRKPTPVLGGLGKAARKRALSGAIAVTAAKAPQLRGASVILVDDVLTSGATTQACVSALKRAGVERVIVACVARVLDEAL